jgi:hypothetical protein
VAQRPPGDERQLRHWVLRSPPEPPPERPKLSVKPEISFVDKPPIAAKSQSAAIFSSRRPVLTASRIA